MRVPVIYFKQRVITEPPRSLDIYCFFFLFLYVRATNSREKRTYTIACTSDTVTVNSHLLCELPRLAISDLVRARTNLNEVNRNTTDIV